MASFEIASFGPRGTPIPQVRYSYIEKQQKTAIRTKNTADLLNQYDNTRATSYLVVKFCEVI
jgi:hypothetical protein